MNHFDNLAKLLATENLTVVRASVKTASFDTQSRVLTLPQWKFMTNEIETMLVGHEVGHALYTDISMLKHSVGNRALHGYINVIEDVRIERLMKEKFPGLRKDFISGYKQLNERDFFGAKEVDLETLPLIDRINLYFKVGMACGVRFNKDEHDFVRRAEKTETPDDVIKLAEEILAYAEKQKQKEDEERAQQEEEFAEIDQEPENEEFDDDYDNYGDEDEDEDGDEIDFQPPSDESEKKVETTNTSSGRSELLPTEEDNKVEQTDEVDVPRTQKAMDEKLNELADTDVVYETWTMNNKVFGNPLVDFKTVIEETEEFRANYPLDEDLTQFMEESKKVVSYLVKEFEMKKSATAYKRQTTSKSGSLDMKKLYSYTMNEDIFKRITVLPEGKNHGMLFLLDWSGSMTNVINDTIKQLIPLVMFCRRVGIPFQTLAFSSQYRRKAETEYAEMPYDEFAEARKNNVIIDYGRYHLIEFFSNKMSNAEFNIMVKTLLNPYLTWHKQYALGGTPLNEALYNMISYVPAFIKKNNVEKMTLVTLTDGEGGKNIDTNRWTYVKDENGLEKRKAVKSFLRDHVTNREYEIPGDGSHQTQLWLKVLKDRYGIATIGFHVCPNRKYDIRNALTANSKIDWWVALDRVMHVRKQFREHGFYSVKGTARDEMFIVPTTALKLRKEEDLQVTEKMTSRQIAKKFGKALTKSRTSRILLDRFVARVA